MKLDLELVTLTIVRISAPDPTENILDGILLVR